MAQTKKLTNRQIRNIAPFLQELSTRSLPGVSLVRLGHTMDELQPIYQNVIEKRQEKTSEYQGSDMEGNDVYVDQEGDRYVVMGGEEPTRDYSIEDDDVDVEDKPETPPPETRRRAYIPEGQREAYNEEIESMLDDNVSVTVHPFPEDETEAVMSVVEDVIAENVEQEDSEESEDFAVSLQSIRPILFMFEKN